MADFSRQAHDPGTDSGGPLPPEAIAAAVRVNGPSGLANRRMAHDPAAAAETTADAADPSPFADLSVDELDSVYQRALDALEQIEHSLPVAILPEPEAEAEAAELTPPPLLVTSSSSETSSSPADESPASSLSSEWTNGDGGSAVMSRGEPAGSSQLAGSTAARSAPATTTNPRSLSAAASAGSEGAKSLTDSPAEEQATVEQVVEACVFVGKASLTARKLASTIRNDFPVEQVEEAIAGLNRRYAAEGRPYEIVMGTEGYVLTLREEFERLRQKLYGQGPRDVRLSQDVLEVLAIVAFHEPISEPEVLKFGRPQSAAILRQLLRRELIELVRDPAAPKEVRYRVTNRFLSVFGLGSLDELPRPEDLAFK